MCQQACKSRRLPLHSVQGIYFNQISIDKAGKGFMLAWSLFPFFHVGQDNPTQPNTTQPSPTQPNTTQISPTQPKTTQPKRGLLAATWSPIRASTLAANPNHLETSSWWQPVMGEALKATKHPEDFSAQLRPWSNLLSQGRVADFRLKRRAITMPAEATQPQGGHPHSLLLFHLLLFMPS